MNDTFAYSHPLRRTALAQRKPTRFTLTPDASELQAIAQALGIDSIKHASFKGEIRPKGRADFALVGDLDATVVQACIITLAPVTTNLRESVTRFYVADWQEPEAEESEVPEDDSAEPLGDEIDVGAVMIEALALALPQYPRAKGAELGSFVAAPSGAEPLTDEKIRPFSGLADLMKKRSE